MDLRRFAYISRVNPTVATMDLRHIVGLAETLHRRHVLTGVLAYTGSHFLQFIEGPELNVEQLLGLIRSDARHSEMRVLCDCDIARRGFEQWYSLHVERPSLIEEIAHAHAVDTQHSGTAQYFMVRVIEQLREADLIR